MKWFLFSVAVAVCLLTSPMDADDKPKPGGAVAALPPHPLDSAFEKGRTVKEIDEGLLNNEHYAKAVKEALKAKQAQEKRYKEIPNLRDASPSQVARRKFLEILLNEKQEPGEAK